MNNATRSNAILFSLLLIIFSIGIIRYQIQLLSYLEWEDEVTHIVTSKLIHAGKTLYSEIHELHGPLTFLSGLVVELIGNFGIRGHRIPILILQWLAWISIYFSPTLKHQSSFVRLTYVLVCATISVIYLPDIFGHTYLFQVIAGLFLVIILSQYILPAIIDPSSQSKNRVILGNALIACLPFLAFTYIPISVALFLSALTKKFLRISLIAIATATTLNIIFLSIIGSIPGYLAMHYWINLAVSRQFIEGEVLGPIYLVKSALNAISVDLSRFGIFLLISSALVSLCEFEKKLPWRTIMLGLGIASLLTRAQGFQGLTLMYTAFAIPLVFFYASKSNAIQFFQARWFLMPIWIVCLIKIFLLSPANISDRKIRDASPFSDLVKKITEPKDTIIAWPFQNYEYILSNRLPASGNFFYLPWQPAYYSNPKFGINIDTCKELQEKMPKVLLISEYAFGNIKWNEYKPICLEKWLNENYYQMPDSSYFIRNDIVKKID